MSMCAVWMMKELPGQVSHLLRYEDKDHSVKRILDILKRWGIHLQGAVSPRPGDALLL